MSPGVYDAVPDQPAHRLGGNPQEMGRFSGCHPLPVFINVVFVRHKLILHFLLLYITFDYFPKFKLNNNRFMATPDKNTLGKSDPGQMYPGYF